MRQVEGGSEFVVVANDVDDAAARALVTSEHAHHLIFFMVRCESTEETPGTPPSLSEMKAS
jgi:hypothetical protein